MKTSNPDAANEIVNYVNYIINGELIKLPTGRQFDVRLSRDQLTLGPAGLMFA